MDICICNTYKCISSQCLFYFATFCSTVFLLVSDSDYTDIVSRIPDRNEQTV